VCLGIDLCDEDEEDFEFSGYDPKCYPPFPVTYPSGLANFRDFPSFAARANARGLGASFVTGLMGDNYARAVGGVA
jgi:membrane dipeptidase